MGKVRVCGKRCHNAKRAACRCWCGGVFHGEAGELARHEFRQTFDVDKVPTTERAFDDLTRQPSLFDEPGIEWRDLVAAAVEARS